MKMRNLVREKIAEKGYALGAFVASSSAMNCEILGINGMDFVVIDCEHAETNSESIVQMCRAAELYGMAPLVRAYDPNDTLMMSRLLDIGVHGVMAPLVGTAEQAQKIVQCMKFPPLGKRGANGGRGPRWGAFEDYVHAANDNSLVIMQCESLEGLRNIEEIAATPGLDVIFVGTGDLSLELGITFKADSGSNHAVDDPQIVAAIEKVMAACKKNDVIPGIVTASAEDAARRIKQGFQFVTCMNDLGFFRSHTYHHIQTVRTLVEE